MFEYRDNHQFFIDKTRQAIRDCCDQIGVQRTEIFFNQTTEELESCLNIEGASLTDKINSQLRQMSTAAVIDSYNSDCRAIDIVNAARILSDCVISCFNAQPTMHTSQFYDIPPHYITDMIKLIECGFVTQDRINVALSSYRNANFDLKNKFSSVFTFVSKKLTETHRDYESYEFFLQQGANTTDMELFFGLKKNAIQKLKKEFNISPMSTHKNKSLSEKEKCDIWLYIEQQSQVINRFYNETPIPAETIINLVKINPHGYQLNDFLESIKYCLKFGDQNNQLLTQCFLYDVKL